MDTRIDKREELLSFVVRRIVYVYIKRAINDGPVENLGAFTRIGPNKIAKGWIVKVTTRTKRDVYIGVSVSTLERGPAGYVLDLIEEVCWAGWCGDKYPDKKLYAGDNPEHYAELKRMEIEDELQAEDN
jgi:hypothetical protein